VDGFACEARAEVGTEADDPARHVGSSPVFAQASSSSRVTSPTGPCSASARTASSTAGERGTTRATPDNVARATSSTPDERTKRGTQLPQCARSCPSVRACRARCHPSPFACSTAERAESGRVTPRGHARPECRALEPNGRVGLGSGARHRGSSVRRPVLRAHEEQVFIATAVCPNP
jgi:hypothetical protein